MAWTTSSRGMKRLFIMVVLGVFLFFVFLAITETNHSTSMLFGMSASKTFRRTPVSSPTQDNRHSTRAPHQPIIKVFTVGEDKEIMDIIAQAQKYNRMSLNTPKPKTKKAPSKSKTDPKSKTKETKSKEKASKSKEMPSISQIADSKLQETDLASKDETSSKVVVKTDSVPKDMTVSPSEEYYNSESAQFQLGLQKMGVESSDVHDFKSPYIITPHVYSDYNNTVLKPPGDRKVKVISMHSIRESKWVKHASIFVHNNDFKKCPYSECVLDGDGLREKEADLLLFLCKDLRDMPKTRPAGQLWAIACWESPEHWNYPDNSWKSVFNLTMGYMRNLDLGFIHDYLMWRDSGLLLKDEDYLSIAKRKTKTAAWMVSNCNTPSQRMKYVKEMQKYIDIDIYGKCGTLQCPRSKEDQCQEWLNTTYKFYLSFENSFCLDYATYKLFSKFDPNPIHIIPVVRGGFDYARFLPHDILVDSKNFKSAKELALHLKDLSGDETRYAKMLREKHRLVMRHENFDWCDICEGLHTGRFPGRVIPDVSQETHPADVCWTPNDIY